MKNLMNLTVPMNWGIYVQNLFGDLLLKADDKKKRVKRPSVTSYEGKPKTSDVIPIPPEYTSKPKRPIVTSVTIKKKTVGDDNTYHYTFSGIQIQTFDKYKGTVTIKINYNNTPKPSLVLTTLEITKGLKGSFELAPITKSSQSSFFGINKYGTNQKYEFNIVVLDDNGKKISKVEATFTFEKEPLSLIQLIGKFFKNLFK